TLRGSCGELDAQPTPPDEGVMVLGTCDELDAFVSIPDEGDMTFLRKKGKSGAAVGKLVLLQVPANFLESSRWFLISRLLSSLLYAVIILLAEHWELRDAVDIIT
ncbi:hypothetical protein Tco_0872637, partial [Tanacetum coccineum]